MDYYKITCRLTPDNELSRELLFAELGTLGFESFTENDDHTEAYIPVNQFSDELLVNASQGMNNLYTATFEKELIKEKNWNEVWEKNYFKPLVIDDKCLIRAPFHTDYPKAEYEIIIDPQMAFGTGNHETTHLMIASILEQKLTNKEVLDMGCGSGILSILASMKGATSVTAVDIDEWSFRNTVENARINNCENIQPVLGGAETLGTKKFDALYANIQRNILLQDMDKYVSVMKNGAEIIMSGFYIQDLEAIQQKAISLNLNYQSHKERKNWVAARFVLQLPA